MPRPDRLWIPSLETLPYTGTNPSVRIFRHALALDERRRMFRVARWRQPQDHVPNRFRPAETAAQDIEQRWFAGVHSDIGGGYRERDSGLSKIPLIWMTEEAVKAGLRITEANLRHLAYGESKAGSQHSYARPDPLAKLHQSLTAGWKLLEYFPKNIKYREWQRRSFLGWYLPRGEPRPVPAEHRLDEAIDQRRRGDASYHLVNVPANSPKVKDEIAP